MRCAAGAIDLRLIGESDLVDRLAFVLGDLRIHDGCEPQGDQAEVTVEHSPSGYLLRGARARIGRRPRAQVVDQLVGELNRLAATRADAVTLHGALMSRRDEGVLVLGESGAGKSTLALGLLQQGWTYHTDEVISLALDASRVSGLPKPLTLKRGTRAVCGDVGAIDFGDVVGAEPAVAYLRASSVGLVSSAAVVPRLAVLPQRVASCPSPPRRLGSVEAAVVVHRHRFEQNAARDTLGPVVRLTQRCPVFELEVSTLPGALAALDGLWTDLDEPGSEDVEEFPRRAAGAGGVALAPDVTAWRAGDEALLHARGRQLTRVSPWPRVLTSLLDGRSSAERIGRVVAGMLDGGRATVDGVTELLARLGGDGLLDLTG